uniref:Uncharacterized protein n=1 Tax=Cacopsylla melanoneura TaxID=428564 RepID=A0A8D9A0I1_9HEMI
MFICIVGTHGLGTSLSSSSSSSINKHVLCSKILGDLEGNIYSFSTSSLLVRFLPGANFFLPKIRSGFRFDLFLFPILSFSFQFPGCNDPTSPSVKLNSM